MDTSYLESFNSRQGKLTNGIGKLINGIHNTHHTHKRLFVISSQDQAGFKHVVGALVEHIYCLGPDAWTPEYLANLEHTLAVARSGLLSRASILAESAAELREKLSTEPGENATRASTSQPRIR